MGFLSERRSSKRLANLMVKGMRGGTFETACAASQVLDWFKELEGIVDGATETSVSIQLPPEVQIRMPNAPADPAVGLASGRATIETSEGRELLTRFTITLTLTEQGGYMNMSGMVLGRFIERVATVDPTCKSL